MSGYAALHLPNFALQAALRLSRREASAPVALVDGEAKKPLVLEMSEAASRSGVRPGLPVPQALARCAELAVLHRSSQAESLAAGVLFEAGYSLSPRVEMVSGDLCLVDLQGADSVSVRSRCAEILAELGDLGLVCRIGLADTGSISLLAAKSATAGGMLVVGEMAGSGGVELGSEDFLAALPISATEASEALLDILDKWGIRTVAAFAALPRAAVGSRLGCEGLELWDRMAGKERRLVPVASLAEKFEQSWDFEYEVDSLEPLLFLLRRFLDQLCWRMRRAGKAARLMRVELTKAYGGAEGLEMTAPEPTGDAAALFLMGQGRLGALELDSPIRAFRLELESVALVQRQFGLFESGVKDPRRFAQTLADLAGIVGEGRVGRPVLASDGRPDGFTLERMPDRVEPMREEASLDFQYGMALRRLRPAVPAQVELAERQLTRLRSGLVSGAVRACRGPWLSSGGWWESAGSWNRVEWDVELETGGVYRVVKSEDGWSLEGELF